jgi:hypothetical protein
MLDLFVCFIGRFHCIFANLTDNTHHIPKYNKESGCFVLKFILEILTEFLCINENDFRLQVVNNHRRNTTFQTLLHILFFLRFAMIVSRIKGNKFNANISASYPLSPHSLPSIPEQIYLRETDMAAAKMAYITEISLGTLFPFT